MVIHNERLHDCPVWLQTNALCRRRPSGFWCRVGRIDRHRGWAIIHSTRWAGPVSFKTLNIKWEGQPSK